MDTARRESFRAMCERRELERREVFERNSAAAGESGPFVFRKPCAEPCGDAWAVLHPSSRRGGAWQVSYFDSRGPYTHEEFETRADAVRYLSGYSVPSHMCCDSGWEPGDAVRFEEVSRGASFRAPPVH